MLDFTVGNKLCRMCERVSGIVGGMNINESALTDTASEHFSRDSAALLDENMNESISCCVQY